MKKLKKKRKIIKIKKIKMRTSIKLLNKLRMIINFYFEIIFNIKLFDKLINIKRKRSGSLSSILSDISKESKESKIIYNDNKAKNERAAQFAGRKKF